MHTDGPVLWPVLKVLSERWTEGTTRLNSMREHTKPPKTSLESIIYAAPIIVPCSWGLTIILCPDNVRHLYYIHYITSYIIPIRSRYQYMGMCGRSVWISWDMSWYMCCLTRNCLLIGCYQEQCVHNNTNMQLDHEVSPTCTRLPQHAQGYPTRTRLFQYAVCPHKATPTCNHHSYTKDKHLRNSLGLLFLQSFSSNDFNCFAWSEWVPFQVHVV